MAPRWLQKLTKNRDASTDSSVDPGLPSSPTPHQAASSAPQISPQRLQERLWNQAYDELKANEPAIVDSYERILSGELNGARLPSTDSASQNNEIYSASEKRWRQMEQLVLIGLEKTKNDAALKQRVDQGVQFAKSIKKSVDHAVQASPEAALAWVGVCFAIEIISNPVTESGINRQGLIYVVSRMDWYWNLVDLLLDENKAVVSSAGLRDQLEKHIIQLYEKLLLYQIKSVCIHSRSQTAVLFKDMFKLDDWNGKLTEIRDAEAAVRRDSEQYNTEQIRSHLQTIAITADAQQLKLDDIHSAIQDQTRQQDKLQQDEKDVECLRDLRETDPRDDKTRIQQTKGGLLRDSYRWILDHADFKEWRDDPDSRLLWIKGDPGKGKTMLLCGIIDELEGNTAHSLSYFFCQATEARLNHATAVLRGLLYCLVDQQPSLVSYVRAKYDRAGKQLFEDINAWAALSKILTDMLSDTILDGAFLVIDALDECGTDLPQLLDFITQASSSSRVKWIVSSRNWPSIEEKLDSTTQKVRLCLELNEDSISTAVHIYIQHRVGQLALQKKYDEETREAVHRYLSANANNTFLWVALVCQQLADPSTRRRHTKEKLATFPPGLDSLYMRMMENINDSNDADLCRQILAVVSVAYRPITLHELASFMESLDGDLDDLGEVIASCGSFFTVREEIVYFVHQSAKDFLLSKASDQIMPSGIAYQHRTIFLKSLEVLSRSLRRDIYNLNAPGCLIEQITPPIPDPMASVRYSCIYWVDHLGGSSTAEREGSDIFGSKVYAFLREKYLYWLEALSLSHSMAEGVMAMRKLRALSDSTEAPKLGRLLHDAYRFILSYGSAVELAPLQAYAAGLAFSPTRSLVRKLFEHEAPDWITSMPRVEPDWSSCLQTLEGHSSAVKSVAYSTNGRQLVSGCEDASIKLWDTATGVCLQTLQGHSDSVKSIVFSTDGRILASASNDSTVRIWDIATNICIRILLGHIKQVNSVAFSGDDRLLMSGSSDNMVKIWDVDSGVCIRTLQGHDDEVTSVAFSRDNRQIASGSKDETSRIWDADTGECLHTLKSSGDGVFSVDFSRDGHRLASGSNVQVPRDRGYSVIGSVDIWDTVTGVCTQRLNDIGWAISLAFSNDDRTIASGSEFGAVCTWDAATGRALERLDYHRGAVESVVFSSDGKQLASASNDGTVRIWDTAKSVKLQTPERQISNAAEGASFDTLESDNHSISSRSSKSDSRNFMATQSSTFWDKGMETRLETLNEYRVWIGSHAFSVDGKQLILTLSNQTAGIWDTTTGNCLKILNDVELMRPLAFSGAKHLLASAVGEGTLQIWDMTRGVHLQTLEGHTDSVAASAFSEDNRQLVTGSHDLTIKIWDLITGGCLQTLRGHTNWVSAVALSVDGRQLASGSFESISPEEADDAAAEVFGRIRLWDTATGACVRTIGAHGSWVDSVAFSADGRKLASGGRDGVAAIWDVTNGACYQRFSLGGWVRQVSFDPTTDSRLFTNLGALILDPFSTSSARLDGIPVRDARHSGYGISADGKWIVRKKDKILWLPTEYRKGQRSGVSGLTVLLDRSGNRISIMQLSAIVS